MYRFVSRIRPDRTLLILPEPIAAVESKDMVSPRVKFERVNLELQSPGLVSSLEGIKAKKKSERTGKGREEILFFTKCLATQ